MNNSFLFAIQPTKSLTDFFATKINYSKNWEALIQLGLEYLTFEFEYRVLWSSVLEWFNFGMVRTIQKWNYYLRINDGSQMFGLRMVWLSGFQMAFEYQTIGHTTSFQPFEYQTSLAYRSPLQWGSEIWPVEIWKHSKSGLFEGRISNGPYVVGFQMVPSSQPFENQKKCRFSQDRFIYNFFVYNNKQSRLNEPFKIRTIRKPDKDWPPKSGHVQISDPHCT